MNKLLITTAIFFSLISGANAAYDCGKECPAQTLSQEQLKILRLPQTQIEALRLSQVKIEALQAQIKTLQAQQLKLLPPWQPPELVRYLAIKKLNDDEWMPPEIIKKLEDERKNCWLPPGAKYAIKKPGC